MTSNNDLWVFAYGSLMWDPGFDYAEVLPARLFGYHRSFCILSWTFRGRRDRPGLVLGLDNGGSCIGRAFRVDDGQREKVVNYLDGRETPDIRKPGVVVDVYRRKLLPVQLPEDAGEQRRVPAICYVCERTHEQYAGNLSPEAQLKYILQGEGSRGTSVEYLANTVRHIDDLGISDGPLHRLWGDVQANLSAP